MRRQNCTRLPKHRNDAYQRDANLRAYQETCLPNDKLGVSKAMLAANKWDGHYSVASPETSKPTAGVATMTKQPDITVPDM